MILIGCARIPIPANLIARSNPENPFQGTYLQMATTEPALFGEHIQYLILINDDVVTSFSHFSGVYGTMRGWKIASSSTFEKLRDRLLLSDDGSILTLEGGMSFKRVE
jgi:hypothetical protein